MSNPDRSKPKTQGEIQKSIDAGHAEESDIFLGALLTIVNVKTDGFKKSARILLNPLAAQVARLVLCDLADAKPAAVKEALLRVIGIEVQSPANGEADRDERHLSDVYSTSLQIFDTSGYEPREGPGNGLVLDFKNFNAPAAS